MTRSMAFAPPRAFERLYFVFMGKNLNQHCYRFITRTSIVCDGRTARKSPGARHNKKARSFRLGLKRNQSVKVKGIYAPDLRRLKCTSAHWSQSRPQNKCPRTDRA